MSDREIRASHILVSHAEAQVGRPPTHRQRSMLKTVNENRKFKSPIGDCSMSLSTWPKTLPTARPLGKVAIQGSFGRGADGAGL